MSRVTLAIAAVLLIAGCGGNGKADEMSNPLAVASHAADQAGGFAEMIEAQQRADDCRSHLSPLLRELRDIDAQLNVGMTQAEYESALDSASLAYEYMSPAEAGVTCIGEAGLPLEVALNRHFDANTLWDDCNWDLSCDTDSIDPELQRHWRVASNKIGRAMEVLHDMADPEWMPRDPRNAGWAT